MNEPRERTCAVAFDFVATPDFIHPCFPGELFDPVEKKKKWIKLLLVVGRVGNYAPVDAGRADFLPFRLTREGGINFSGYVCYDRLGIFWYLSKF